MQLPTKRISLNRQENAVICTGLNRIVNEFLSLQISHRRAPDVIDTRLKPTLQPRALAPCTYESILTLRNRLASVAGENRAKYRFNVVEYAMLAFAARVARRFANVSVPEELTSKLETYRKRAKRRAFTQRGAAVYQRLAREWACSARWIRFNLLPLPVRPAVLVKPRRIYREQFEQMLNLSRTTIAERCDEHIEELQLRSLVVLVIREIRRGRHPGERVRTLLRDEERAKNFLFEVLKRKKPDLKLKFEFRTLVEQKSERAARFRAALVVVDPGDHAPADSDGLRFLEDLVVYRVARFLRIRVNCQAWDEVAAVAAAIAKNSKALSPSALVPGELSFDELLRASTPDWEPEVGTGEVEHFAAWLLNFLMQCGATPEKAVQMLRQSVELASQMSPHQCS